MAYLYKRMKKQVSYDGGITWQDADPPEYIVGELIDGESDCVPEETMNVKLESDESK